MSRSLTLGLVLLATFFEATSLEAQENCAVTRQLSATLNPATANRLSVVGRAGSLRIVGRPGLSEVRVSGEACASRTEILDRVAISTGLGAEGAFVEATIPESRAGFLRSDYARLDLLVEMPEALALNVTDGSGSLEISDVRNGIEIQDGSGDIDVRNSDGSVRVRDGSGGLTIEAIRGSVFIEDGSGAVDIRDITGNVVIREDGSGAIDVRRVSGNFELGRDGSGGRMIDQIGGTVSLPRRR